VADTAAAAASGGAEVGAHGGGLPPQALCELELRGVVNHLGHSASAGHYTTCSRERYSGHSSGASKGDVSKGDASKGDASKGGASKSGAAKEPLDQDLDIALAAMAQEVRGTQWKEFDDSRVKVVSEYDAVMSRKAQTGAYIFVYVSKQDLA
jgi:hypothetical protein